MMTEASLPKIPAHPFELAIPVSDRVQIKNIFTMACRAKRGESARFATGGFGLKYHQVVEGVIADRAASQIKVRLSFSVITTKDGDPELDPLMQIDATFELVYSLESFEGIEDQNLQAFACTNGVYNAWPYWREFVQSTTTRMGLPALVPPVFRFPKAHEPSIPAEPEQPSV